MTAPIRPGESGTSVRTKLNEILTEVASFDITASWTRDTVYPEAGDTITLHYTNVVPANNDTSHLELHLAQETIDFGMVTLRGMTVISTGKVLFRVFAVNPKTGYYTSLELYIVEAGKGNVPISSAGRNPKSLEDMPSLTLKVGETFTLVVKRVNGDIVPNNQLQFHSEAPEKATVSSAGVVTAVGTGDNYGFSIKAFEIKGDGNPWNPKHIDSTSAYTQINPA